MCMCFIPTCYLFLDIVCTIVKRERKRERNRERDFNKIAFLYQV